jgi:hypothetical protein
MEIRITVEGPRWVRLPRRRSLKLALALVAALVVAVPVAWATDRFGDVPAASPHHNDINTIADAGITGGCNPPTNTLYCPGDAVRRDQMATFLTRGLGRIAVSQTALVSSVTRSSTSSYVDVGEVTINVGGTGGTAKQYVKVDASLNIYNTTECPCFLRLRILDVSTGQMSFGGHYQTLAQYSDHTYPAVGVFDSAPGARTFRLQVWYSGYTTGADPQAVSVAPYLVATTYPFLSGSAAHSATPSAKR